MNIYFRLAKSAAIVMLIKGLIAPVYASDCNLKAVECDNTCYDPVARQHHNDAGRQRYL